MNFFSPLFICLPLNFLKVGIDMYFNPQDNIIAQYLSNPFLFEPVAF